MNALAGLPQLRELRLTGNPVLHLSSLSGRNECIARLAAITQLNGAAIGAHERRDCELQYLYRVQQRIADLGPTGPAEAALHPRLEELRAKHGDMAIQPRQVHIAADATLGDRLVALDLVCTGMVRLMCPTVWVNRFTGAETTADAVHMLLLQGLPTVIA